MSVVDNTPRGKATDVNPCYIVYLYRFLPPSVHVLFHWRIIARTVPMSKTRNEGLIATFYSTLQSLFFSTMTNYRGYFPGLWKGPGGKLDAVSREHVDEFFYR